MKFYVLNQQLFQQYLKGKYCCIFGRITTENNDIDIQNLKG